MTRQTTINHLIRQLQKAAMGSQDARRAFKRMPHDDIFDIWLADLDEIDKRIERVIDGLNRQKENAT